MNEEFAYANVKGYPLAEIHGRTFLVDTSMPFTLAERPLVLGGEKIEVADEVVGLSLGKIRSAIDLPMDGVLGANVTDRFALRVKPQEQVISLDDYQDALPIEVAVENLGGMPVMHETVNGQRLKAALAIGGPLSWVKSDLVAEMSPVGRDRDVLGFVGAVETDIYELPVDIAYRQHKLRFGVLPEALEHLLDMANVQAIIGSELIEHYAMSLNMREGELALEPRRILH